MEFCQREGRSFPRKQFDEDAEVGLIHKVDPWHLAATGDLVIGYTGPGHVGGLPEAIPHFDPGDVGGLLGKPRENIVD